MKKFVGIRFKQGDTWAIVPKTWLSQNNTMTYWPDSGHVDSLAKAERTPQPTWNLWAITNIDVWSGWYFSHSSHTSTKIMFQNIQNCI
jgi:hypothetical protein